MNRLVQDRLAPLAQTYRTLTVDACRRLALADIDKSDPHRALADWGYLGEPVTGTVVDPSMLREFTQPLLSDHAVDQLMATVSQPQPPEAADRGYLDRQMQTDYRLDVFGDPASPDGWAWRLNGPHVGLHFAVGTDGAGVSVTPLFLGAAPPSREADGIAVALTDSFTDEQQRTALVDPLRPAEIRTRHDRQVFLPGVPDGIAYPLLTEQQQARLDELLLHHLATLRPLSGLTRDDLHPEFGLETLTFAYAGEPGKAWYYCLKSPRLVIEHLDRYGHLHAVLRDTQSDWAGLDRKWPAT